VLLIPKRHRRTDGQLTVASPRSALASRGKKLAGSHKKWWGDGTDDGQSN